MSRPLVGPATDRVYDRLPDVYREGDLASLRERGYGDDYADGTTGTYGGAGTYGGDAALVPSFPLLRYLSLLLDQLTPAEELYERLDYLPADSDPRPPQLYSTGTYGAGTYGDLDTADLVDPLRADAAWLPWLAQTLGVSLAGVELDVAAQRARLSRPEAAWVHGTTSAIAEAVRPQLTGDRYVDTIPNHKSIPFTIGLVTKREETTGATTFAELKAIAPTWADLKRLGDFSNLAAADVLRAADVERPAGYRLEHVWLDQAAF